MAAGFESLDSFGARASLEAGGATHTIYRLDRAAEALGCDLARLPFTLRILLENLLRGEDGSAVSADSIRALGAWQAQATPSDEVAFRPRACCSRTSPASRRSWTSPRCATRWPISAATPRGSTRSSPSTS